MRKLLIAFGVLLTCLPSTATDSASEGNTQAVSSTDKSGTNGNKADKDLTWSCPENWTPYVDSTEISCLWLQRKVQSFHAAVVHCQNLGGGLVTFTSTSKENFVKSFAKKVEVGDYWVGLSKDRGYDTYFQWHSRNGRAPPSTDNLPQQLKDYLMYKAQCAFLNTFNEELEMEECESEYFAICEKDIVCKPGTFGNKCERECHCAGEPCNQTDFYQRQGVTCAWGCQRNWMGVACDIEKQDPEVKYFCINSPERDGKYIYIRINTKGVQYRAIYGLTAKKARGDWCSSTVTDTSEDPHLLTTIKIPLNNASIQQMRDGRCVGEIINDNTFSWEIVVKENDGILLEHDLVISITCDFSVAEKLIRSDQYTIDGEPAHVNHVTVIPESIAEDVVLHVVDAYSGQPVKEAAVGSTVILQLKHGLQKGSLLKGVFPYNCVASSGDGNIVKQLLDEKGCQVAGSPLHPFTVSNEHTVATPWFNLFAFEDEQTVTFQCSFGLCFTSNCNVGCRKPSRSKRAGQDKKDEAEHSTTRTIRVLPSIPAQKSSGDSPSIEYQTGPPPLPGPAASSYEIGPFIYLNPVTCTLFLLILLIFICMYLSFLRTLRKSVYDIRKEIQIKRSRDKFLHCGCAQQVDRGYVAP